MINKNKTWLVFCVSLVAPLILFRLYIHFYHNSLLKSITGLNLHHLHYGIILLVISSLILIFYKTNLYSVALTGFGLGLVLDEFIPSLFLKTTRGEELLTYNQNFIGTIVLFLGVISLSVLIYFLGKKPKN